MENVIFFHFAKKCSQVFGGFIEIVKHLTETVVVGYSSPYSSSPLISAFDYSVVRGVSTLTAVRL